MVEHITPSERHGNTFFPVTLPVELVLLANASNVTVNLLETWVIYKRGMKKFIEIYIIRLGIVSIENNLLKQKKHCQML